MKAKITWDGEARFIAESESEHRVIMDGPPEHGGKNVGPRPMEMMLMGMGGCAAFDVVHILKKGRQSIASCTTEVDATRSNDVPAVFTKIHLNFLVSGDNLKENILILNQLVKDDGTISALKEVALNKTETIDLLNNKLDKVFEIHLSKWFDENIPNYLERYFNKKDI